MPLQCFRKNPRGFLGATASQQNPLYIPNQVAWSHEHTGAHKAVVDAAEVVLEMLGRWRRGLRGKLRDSGDEGISIPSSLNNYRTVKPQRERLMISDRTFCTVGYSKSEAGCGADKIDAGPVEFVQSWSNSLRNFGPALGSPEMAAMAAQDADTSGLYQALISEGIHLIDTVSQILTSHLQAFQYIRASWAPLAEQTTMNSSPSHWAGSCLGALR